MMCKKCLCRFLDNENPENISGDEHVVCPPKPPAFNATLDEWMHYNYMLREWTKEWTKGN